MATDKPDTSASILSEFVEYGDNKIDVNSQLQRAYDIQGQCALVGFDWPDAQAVFDKVIEELKEVQEAIANSSKNQEDVEEELGDLLFTCVNLCRHLQISPDSAIYVANQKFIKRFQQIEFILKSEGEKTEEQSLERLDALWNAVKSSAK